MGGEALGPNKARPPPPRVADFSTGRKEGGGWGGGTSL